MLARLFGHINSSTNILVVAWAIIVCTVHVFVFQNTALTFQTLWSDVHLLPWVVYATELVVVIIIAFTAQWLLDYQHHVIKRHAYLPFFIIPLLLMFTGQRLNVLLLFLLLLLLLGSWLSVYTGERVYRRVLNTGLLLGVGSLIDLRVALLVPFTYVVYIVFGRFNLRTSLIVLIGFFSIWVNALGLEYVVYDTLTFWDYFLGLFLWRKPIGLAEFEPLLLGLLGFLALMGFLELPKTMSRASVFKRQTYVVLTLLLVLTASGFIIFPVSHFQLTTLLFTALILFVNYFQYITKIWIRDGIMWLTMAAYVFSQYTVL